MNAGINTLAYLNHDFITSYLMVETKIIKPSHMVQACMLSHFSSVWLCDPMSCRFPGSLPMGFSRQACWSGLPCLPAGDCPNPGTKPLSAVSPALAGRFFTSSATQRENPATVHGVTKREKPLSDFHFQPLEN